MSVGIYCRISKATKDEDGIDTLGVERQESLCRALAERLGLDVSDVYVDNNLSGKAGVVRPEYERLLADVLAGRITTVMAWKTDRLSRDRLALGLLYELLKTHGAKLVTDQEGEITLTTPDGALMAGIRAELAAYERAVTAERVKAQKRQKAERGDVLGGRFRMFGYTDRSRKELHPVEAPLVKRAFEDYLGGKSARLIMKDLQQAGVTGTGGRPIDLKSVTRIFNTAAYAGIREFDGEVVTTGTWPPIVSVQTFERAKAKSELNKDGRFNNRTPKHMLTGILYCTECNTKWISSSSSGGKRTYRCPPLNGCGRYSRNAELLETNIVRITALALSKVEKREPVKVDTTELDQVTHDIELLNQAVKEKKIPMSVFLDQFQVLSKQKDALTRQSLVSASPSTTVEEFMEASPDRKREVIQSFFPAIGVKPTGMGPRKFSLDQIVIHHAE